MKTRLGIFKKMEYNSYSSTLSSEWFGWMILIKHIIKMLERRVVL